MIKECETNNYKLQSSLNCLWWFYELAMYDNKNDSYYNKSSQ